MGSRPRPKQCAPSRRSGTRIPPAALHLNRGHAPSAPTRRHHEVFPVSRRFAPPRPSQPNRPAGGPAGTSGRDACGSPESAPGSLHSVHSANVKPWRIPRETGAVVNLAHPGASRPPVPARAGFRPAASSAFVHPWRGSSGAPEFGVEQRDERQGLHAPQHHRRHEHRLGAIGKRGVRNRRVGGGRRHGTGGREGRE